MASGILEVLLVSAKGLTDTDFIGDMDPYVIVQYKSQERKSGVARDQGGHPVWNERLKFKVDYPGQAGEYKLSLKIMDKDTFSADDFLGEAKIYVKDLLTSGVENGFAELHPCKYRVVSATQSYIGEIQVGVTFTLKETEMRKRIMMGKSMAGGTRAVFRSPAAILFEINFTTFVIVDFSSLFSLARTMKFEDYLEQQCDVKQKRVNLEEEVEKLQAELDEEQAINKALQCALHGSVSSHPCLATLLPPQVQSLLAELAMVEEEIVWLERKVDELKLNLYQDRKQNKEWKRVQQQQKKMKQQDQLPPSRSELKRDGFSQLSRSQHFDEYKKEKMRFRRPSVGSAAEMISMLSTGSTKNEKPRHTGRIQNEHHICKELCNENPNELSEELVKGLIRIFLLLNQAPPQDREELAIVPKLSLSCMNPKGPKTLFNTKASIFPFNHNESNLDPYRIMSDLDSIVRDIGPYKNFIQIERNSLDVRRLSECLPMAGKLRVLMRRLCNVDLTFLTYKQKLAFWINIYNACIMHGFLEHGLPSSQENLLATMNKAEVNVGGIVLNALAIEHFILRHPCEPNNGHADEKEMLLRHAYGLGYPEPNVTFALCRGSWSSPALRIYTPEEVVNELGRAKVEYLEASVGVTCKRKIVVPKILQWHMRDFADDMESLLEWIYSQLPRSGSLKRLMMECLNGESKLPLTKMVEVQPYESEFRYLLAF
ncbi:hypothetical protein SADUNF_Sadunf10G0156900 [Salix dunnii]|uniref:C2 domain-containing protein n=1 Tax=Salix dunnii TaxID=1413687 RepID=A0A835JSE1_9ROSI|nr:hypothetical protein SADUNF_Sadunf10G0156900 [Salix dunnii]